MDGNLQEKLEPLRSDKVYLEKNPGQSASIPAPLLKVDHASPSTTTVGFRKPVSKPFSKGHIALLIILFHGFPWLRQAHRNVVCPPRAECLQDRNTLVPSQEMLFTCFHNVWLDTSIYWQTVGNYSNGSARQKLATYTRLCNVKDSTQGCPLEVQRVNNQIRLYT